MHMQTHVMKVDSTCRDKVPVSTTLTGGSMYYYTIGKSKMAIFVLHIPITCCLANKILSKKTARREV